MDRRAFAVTATPLHLVITFEDGNVRFLSRKGINIELPIALKAVEVGGVELVWVNETALGATSRADFVSKLQALLGKTGGARKWLWLKQAFTQHRISGETASASSTVFKPASVNGTVATWFSTPTSVYAESFNVNDDAAGSGVRTIRVSGLDDNFAEVEEVLELTGAAAGTPSTQGFRRVNAATIETVGTDFGGNVGSLYVTSAGPSRHLWFGSTYSGSAYGVGQATGDRYTVPAGYTAYVTGLDLASTSGSSWIDMNIWTHSNDTASAPAVLQTRVTHEYPGNVSKPFAAPLVVPAKTDIWLSGRCAGTTYTVQLHLFLVPN